MAMADPLKVLIDNASSIALVSMMERLRTAVEDKRRMEANTYSVAESVLKARLDDLLRMSDEAQPKALMERNAALEGQVAIKQAELATLTEAADAASSAASAAQAEHRRGTKDWGIEVRSIRKQLVRLAGDRKRKAVDLQSESDLDDSPVGRDP